MTVNEFSHLTADEQQRVVDNIKAFFPEAHPSKARFIAQFIISLAERKYEHGEIFGFERGFNEGRRIGKSEGFNAGHQIGHQRGIKQMEGSW